MKYRIAFVVPWFGRLPAYFDLWLNSCAKNSSIDFIFISDQKVDINKDYKNIKYIMMSWVEIQKKIKGNFDFDIKLKYPYKLCDYKPAYGLIFDEYLKNYDFWGYCDIDLIWGDMSKYLTDDVLERYDKLYDCGHCMIYRNNDTMRELFKRKCTTAFWKGYKEVFQTNYICHFDEGGGANPLAQEYNIKFYDKQDYADIAPEYYEFKICNHSEINKQCIFLYDNGKLICNYMHDGSVHKKEFFYVHFQKRVMGIDGNIDKNHFLITPSGFKKRENITTALIRDENYHKGIYWHWISERLKMAKNNFINGTLKVRVKYYSNIVRNVLKSGSKNK